MKHDMKEDTPYQNNTLVQQHRPGKVSKHDAKKLISKQYNGVTKKFYCENFNSIPITISSIGWFLCNIFCNATIFLSARQVSE